MTIPAEKVKELREKTGAGMMDCKKALLETNGDFDQAIDYLRKKGIASAANRAGRATKEGAVFSYIHAGGKIGVLVEVNCETDFVARTEQFKEFVKNISMQIAAANPRWMNPEDVPADVIAKEREIFIAQMQDTGKPQAVLEKIAEGKLRKFYDENCLIKQAYVKDTDKTIENLLKETIGSLGENITVRRFTRYVLGA